MTVVILEKVCKTKNAACKMFVKLTPEWQLNSSESSKRNRNGQKSPEIDKIPIPVTEWIHRNLKYSNKRMKPFCWWKSFGGRIQTFHTRWSQMLMQTQKQREGRTKGLPILWRSDSLEVYGKKCSLQWNWSGTFSSW